MAHLRSRTGLGPVHRLAGSFLRRKKLGPRSGIRAPLPVQRIRSRFLPESEDTAFIPASRRGSRRFMEVQGVYPSRTRKPGEQEWREG